ncbi:hypothetical protein FHG87_020513 [Trinorchestia longiramus]|nr:hypothetical protein FHG87_020513 [Trinorchestia longiramus]
MASDSSSECSSNAPSNGSTTPHASLRVVVLRFRDECERRFELLLSLLQRQEEEAERWQAEEARQAEEVRRLQQQQLHQASQERSVAKELERLTADNARLCASLRRTAQLHEERMAAVADRHRESVLTRRAVRTWQRFVHRRTQQQRSQVQEDLEALREAYGDVRAQLDRLQLRTEAPTRLCSALPNTQTINIYPVPHIPPQPQHVPQQQENILQQQQHVPQQQQHVPQQQQHVPQQQQHQHVPQQQQHVPQQQQHDFQQEQHVPQQPQQHVSYQPQQNVFQQPQQSSYQPQLYHDPQYQHSYYQRPYPAPYYNHNPAHPRQPLAPQSAAEQQAGDPPLTGASHPPRIASLGPDHRRGLDGRQLDASEANVATPATSVPQIQAPGEDQPHLTQQASAETQTTAPQPLTTTVNAQIQTTRDQTTQYQRVTNTDRPPASASASNPFTSKNQTVDPLQGSSQQPYGHSSQGRPFRGVEDQLDALRDRSRSHLQQLQMQRNLRRFNELREELVGDQPRSMDAQCASRSASSDGRPPRVNNDEGDCRRAKHIHVCHCLGPKPARENRPFVCPQCDPLQKTAFRHQPVKEIPSRGILRNKNA